jgi:hypothetical protein
MPGICTLCTIQEQVGLWDVHVWAGILTNASNDIRLNLDQVVDPELILEGIEVP